MGEKNALLIPISITYYSLDGLCASQFKVVSGGYGKNKTTTTTNRIRIFEIALTALVAHIFVVFLFF